MSKDSKGPYITSRGVHVASNCAVMELKDKDPALFKKTLEELDDKARKLSKLPTYKEQLEIDELAKSIRQIAAERIHNWTQEASSSHIDSPYENGLIVSNIGVGERDDSIVRQAVWKTCVDNPLTYWLVNPESMNLENVVTRMKQISAWFINEDYSGEDLETALLADTNPSLLDYHKESSGFVDYKAPLPRILFYIEKNSDVPDKYRKSTPVNSFGFAVMQKREELKKKFPGHMFHVFSIRYSEKQNKVAKDGKK